MATAYVAGGDKFVRNGRTAMSAGQPVVAYASFTFPVAIAASDTVKLLPIPAGARVLDLIVKSTDMDTDGTPALTLNVGDSASATQYLSASTIGQAGGIAQLAIGATAKLKKYTTDDYLSVAVATAPDVGAVGTIEAWLTYCFD